MSNIDKPIDPVLLKRWRDWLLGNCATLPIPHRTKMGKPFARRRDEVQRELAHYLHSDPVLGDLRIPAIRYDSGSPGALYLGTHEFDAVVRYGCGLHLRGIYVSVLKLLGATVEIACVARTEVRGEVERLKKSSAALRSEIPGLKKRIQVLERQLQAQARATRRGGQLVAAPFAVAQSDSQEGGLRFRAAGMAANRKRLGFSAADFGLLVGATCQSVYTREPQRLGSPSKRLGRAS